MADIGIQLADALDYAHARGVVHRDVKPANVLGEAVKHTKTGTVIGTAAYLSPEQVQGQPVDGAADTYSLGVVLLEARTAVRAFPGSPTEAARARLHRAPDIPAQLSPGWRDLLMDMLALEPAARPSAGAIAQRLSGVVEPDSTTPTTVTRGHGGATTTRVLPATASPPATTAAGQGSRRPSIKWATRSATASWTVGDGSGDCPSTTRRSPSRSCCWWSCSSAQRLLPTSPSPPATYPPRPHGNCASRSVTSTTRSTGGERHAAGSDSAVTTRCDRGGRIHGRRRAIRVRGGCLTGSVGSRAGRAPRRGRRRRGRGGLDIRAGCPSRPGTGHHRGAGRGRIRRRRRGGHPGRGGSTGVPSARGTEPRTDPEADACAGPGVHHRQPHTAAGGARGRRENGRDEGGNDGEGNGDKGGGN